MLLAAVILVMVLGQVDAGSASIVGAVLLLVGSITGLMIQVHQQGQAAATAATHAAAAADSIGVKNGHGDLHSAITGIYARLDLQDQASAEERRLRDEGAARQLRILDALTHLQQQLELVKAAQANFATREELEQLQAAVDRLNALLGDPVPGHDPTPALPYIHAAVHDLRGEITRIEATTRTLINEALKAVTEGRAVLDAARAHEQGDPDAP